MLQRRNSQAALRFAERRRREDEAPRLLWKVPRLASLEIEIEERTGAGGSKHIRRFALDSAPALFLVPCGDPRCSDGEHDLTVEVMRALCAHQTSFHGTDECGGALGSGFCSRVLHFEGTAQYTPPP